MTKITLRILYSRARSSRVLRLHTEFPLYNFRTVKICTYFHRALKKLSHLFSCISNNIPTTIKSHFSWLSNDFAHQMIDGSSGSRAEYNPVIWFGWGPSAANLRFFASIISMFASRPSWPLIYRPFVPVSSSRFFLTLFIQITAWRIAIGLRSSWKQLLVGKHIQIPVYSLFITTSIMVIWFMP